MEIVEKLTSLDTEIIGVNIKPGNTANASFSLSPVLQCKLLRRSSAHLQRRTREMEKTEIRPDDNGEDKVRETSKVGKSRVRIDTRVGHW